MIPAEAVEALARVLAQEALVSADMDGHGWDAENDDPAPFMPRARERAHAYLEAAAPHLLAPVAKLADEWHEQGEELMADSKTFQIDEHISVELLKEGATMVENARHIRNAIAGIK